MKKLIAWMLILILAMGCSYAEMSVPENAVLLAMNEKMEIDLDSDGEKEKVQLRMEGVEDEAHE